MNHDIEQSPANLIFLQGKLPSSKDERTALIDLHVCTLHTLQKLALSESRTRTEHASNEMSFRNLITTVFSNKSIDRAQQVYDQVLNSIFQVFKSKNIMDSFMRYNAT